MTPLIFSDDSSLSDPLDASSCSRTLRLRLVDLLEVVENENASARLALRGPNTARRFRRKVMHWDASSTRS